MSTNPELTPERVAEFEARANAGERAAHPGWRFNGVAWRLHGSEYEIHDIGIMDDIEWVVKTAHPAPFKTARLGAFRVLAAAQLAAEWLLMEAVEPLVPGLPELDRLRLDHAALASEIDAVEKALGIPDGPAGWRHPHEVAAELRARVMELEAAAMELADAAKNNVWSLATERAIDRICRAVAKERGDER